MLRLLSFLSPLLLIAMLSVTHGCGPTEVGTERKVCDEKLITKLDTFRDTLMYSLAYRENVSLSLADTRKSVVITFESISLSCLPKNACGTCPGNMVPIRLSIQYDDICQPFYLRPTFSCTRANSRGYVGEQVQVGNLLISCVNSSPLPETYQDILNDQAAFLRSFQLRLYVIRKERG